MYDTSSGSKPATASASVTTRVWPETLGARYPTFWDPSLLTADPRITASTRLPSRHGSLSRRSTTHPTALHFAVPAAFASKARQFPLGDRISPGLYKYPRFCTSYKVDPPASALSHSPLNRLF